MRTASLDIPADHPAYSGHFPGRPLLPGVVLLDHVLLAIGAIGHGTCRDWEVSQVKFLSAVFPGEPLSLQHDVLPNGSVRFSIHAADRAVATGVLTQSRPRSKFHGDQS
jgi:3-hydroxymyristoyl/3-hydroxydecanoyl-(acyl carrier protein) dehydratase